MMTGFACLAVSGLALAFGVGQHSYLWLLPGLLLYGVGLSIVLTVNDPVTLDSIPEADHGQAAGVAATAEQGGGALGIAILYAIFHYVYVQDLHTRVDSSSFADLSNKGYEHLKSVIIAAEDTGLDPSRYPAELVHYLGIALKASERGYAVAFLTVSVLAAVGVVVARIVTKPDHPTSTHPPEPIPETPI